MSRLLFLDFEATTPLVPGVGPAGAATFAMLIEQGAQVTYAWKTDIEKAWSGLEQRICRLGSPQQSYEFTTELTDAQWRTVLQSLVGNAATAQAFLVGLSYEELTLTGAGSTVLPVTSTASWDWTTAGQRVVVVGLDGLTFLNAVIQSTTGTSITVDTDCSSIAKAGARIMPAMAVYLDPQQEFRRYPVNSGPWSIKARAALFQTTWGTGATVNTYTTMPLWDRGNDVNGTVAQPLDAGTVTVDQGALLAQIGAYTVADWGRALGISGQVADWQWLKAFLSTVRGRQVAFLAPTGRPDLTPIGDASTGTLKVSSDAQYASTWFTSLAHRKLQLKMTDGTLVCRTVSTAVDNGDGTQSLTLDTAAAGTIAMVSFLETCRLETDTVTVQWHGSDFSCSLMARVVQQ